MACKTSLETRMIEKVEVQVKKVHVLICEQQDTELG